MEGFPRVEDCVKAGDKTKGASEMASLTEHSGREDDVAGSADGGADDRSSEMGTAASAEADPTTPGDALRALPAEAGRRGTRFVSAQAMQARLFSVYDAAAAAEGALTLVQDQLTLTLDRSYYEAEEIEAMAAQLDALLALEAAEPDRTTPAEPHPG
jgi:hypothetical protein